MLLRSFAARLVLGLTVILCMAVFSVSANATTYYVRADGGTNVQCTGKTDAAYPGSGTGKACAWNNLMEALPPNWLHPEAAHIQGGDTVIIEAGSYPIGWQKGYYQRWGDNCAAQYAPACHPQVIPSGTASNPTRIVGAGWDSGCTAPPELWGTQGPNTMLSLDGASNVVIACLGITDHANCTLNYRPDSSHNCATRATGSGDNDPGLGQYARVGLHAQDSNNVTLQDVNFHGLADQGVQAGRISNWTVTRVKVLGNGNVGWNGDLGGNNHNSSNSGTLTFTDFTVAWNGCQEHYPVDGGYDMCYGQEQGGYGDGLGEAWTGGDWVFIRPQFYRNTSDGLDLLYANGTGSITIDEGYFAYNVGNDLKTAGPATITNSVFIANCSVFRNTNQPVAPNPCRAGGGEFADFAGLNQTITFAYNTVVGEPGCLFGGDPTSTPATGSIALDRSDVVNIENNIFIGKPKWNGDGLTCLVYYGSPPPVTVNYYNNIIWNVRGNDCPATSICKDPQLTDESLASFNPDPLVSSPAIGNGKSRTVTVAWDYYNHTRSPSAPTIGAVEYRGQRYIGSGSGDSPTPPLNGSAQASAPVSQGSDSPRPATSPIPRPWGALSGGAGENPNAERYHRLDTRNGFAAIRVPGTSRSLQDDARVAGVARSVPVANDVIPAAADVARQAVTPATAEPAKRSYIIILYDWFADLYHKSRRLFRH
jgi:hypothetical protein